MGPGAAAGTGMLPQLSLDVIEKISTVRGAFQFGALSLTVATPPLKTGSATAKPSRGSPATMVTVVATDDPSIVTSKSAEGGAPCPTAKNPRADVAPALSHEPIPDSGLPAALTMIARSRAAGAEVRPVANPGLDPVMWGRGATTGKWGAG